MVIVMVHLKISLKDKENIRKMLNAMVGQTRAHANCLHCGFYASTLNDDEMILLQTWKSEADLENHIRSEKFRNFLIVMEHSITPPEIHICKAESMEGVEYVTRVRLKGKNEQAGELVRGLENR
jgi:quinol monooxygenase YgiN